MSRAAQQIAETSPAASTVNALVPPRACSCGAAAGVSNKCSSCAAQEKLGVQPKLAVNRPGDRYEQEADRIADRVVPERPVPLSGPLPVTPLVQRQVEEEEDVQMKAAAVGEAANNVSAPVRGAADVVTSAGKPLSATERSYFEPRFGRDLSAVRIHTDASAQVAALGIRARAYTLRNDIAFAPGEYAPESGEGRRLLAHEITHTLQQGADRTIRRTCPIDAAKIPAGGEEEFETKVDELKAHERYTSLKLKSRRIANHIIDGARASACPMFYITELEALFKTERQAKEETAKKMRKRSSEAVKKEEETIEKSEKHKEETGKPLIDTGLQERMTASKERKFKPERGKGGKIFRIDDRDPTNVFVHMKVRVKKKGIATDQDRDRVEALQDAIERQAATKGYMLDLDFVRRGGLDVFTVEVDPSTWPTARNWISGPGTLAHEAHHLLKLEDRYNLIANHARNVDMEIGTRLVWFREQMVRPVDPLSRSSMMRDSHSTNPLNDEDVCTLVKDDYRGCLVKRIGERTTAQIEGIAKPLLSDYAPEKAALLEVMREAWQNRPADERTAGCDEDDPVCGDAPEAAFGDPKIIGLDAVRLPLKNPHEQKPGRSLKRKRRRRKRNKK